MPPDLLTLRGRDLIAASPVCLYAGLLVPEGVLAHCPPGAINGQHRVTVAGTNRGGDARRAPPGDVARLHSGDLSVWSAMASS